MLKITVNQKHGFDLQPSGEDVIINNQIVKPDIVKISDTQYHLLLQNKSYRITMVEKTDDKHLVIEVNGNRYTVGIQDQYDLLLHDLGMDAALESKAEDTKAPMPGLVIDILVKPGEEVAKDTPLIILEAMKMENVLKATANGVVEKIHVKAKDAVEKGQVLISFQ